MRHFPPPSSSALVALRGFLALALLLVAVSGCAPFTARLQPVTGAEREWLLSGAVLFAGQEPVQKLPDVDVLGMTPQMRAFADRAVAGAHTERRKIDRLVEAINDPDDLGIRYAEQGTYTAAEAFQARRANCLSFTTLVVPMLRYLGIDAQFNEVDIPPVWDLQNNDIFILYRHVNVKVNRSDDTQQVIDINMDDYDLNYPQRIIADRVVQAQYYNNRAMELLLQGQTRDAFRYLRKAIDLAPEQSYLWVNLGALYRRGGHLQAAETALRVALETDSRDLLAISSAERIYQELGQEDLAREFRRRAEKFRRSNPYYHYTLASSAYVHSEYRAALDHIQEAIRRYPREHRFYFLRGAIYQALGERDLAAASMARALELASGNLQRENYRRKIDLIMASRKSPAPGSVEPTAEKNNAR